MKYLAALALVGLIVAAIFCAVPLLGGCSASNTNSGTQQTQAGGINVNLSVLAAKRPAPATTVIPKSTITCAQTTGPIYYEGRLICNRPTQGVKP